MEVAFHLPPFRFVASCPNLGTKGLNLRLHLLAGTIWPVVGGRGLSRSSAAGWHSPPPLEGLPPLSPLYARPESARGRRWLRGHNSPPPLCAASLAWRGDGTVTLVGGGGMWTEGVPRVTSPARRRWMVGWLDGWFVAGGGRVIVRRKPTSWADWLVCARGDCRRFVRTAGLVGWLLRCPGAVVDFYFFCGATMAPRAVYS